MMDKLDRCIFIAESLSDMGRMDLNERVGHKTKLLDNFIAV